MVFYTGNGIYSEVQTTTTDASGSCPLGHPDRADESRANRPHASGAGQNTYRKNVEKGVEKKRGRADLPVAAWSEAQTTDTPNSRPLVGRPDSGDRTHPGKYQGYGN